MKKILTLFSALLLTVSMWGAYTMTSISNFSAEFDSGDAATFKFKAVGYNGTPSPSATAYNYDVQFTVYPTSTSSIVGTYSTNDYNFDVYMHTSKFNWLNNDGSLNTARTLEWDDEQITIEFVSGYTYRMSGTLKARKNSLESAKVYNFSDVEFTYGAPAPTYNTYNFDSYINSTDVTVTNNYSVDGSYVLDFTQYGKERVESPSIGSGTSTVQLKIFPATESLVGTFKVSESTLSSNSYVKSSSGNMRYCQNDAYITITKDEYGVYTLSGDLYAKNSAGNYFHYYFSASDTRNTFTLPDPYDSEPAKVDAGLSLETEVLSANYQSGTILFNLGDFYAGAQLAFTSNSDAQPTANTYSVAASGTNVFLASPGKTSSVQPSYFMVSEDGGWTEDDYFIVSGSLTISYSNDNKQMTIEGTVTSAHGTEITISATGANPWGPKPEVTVDVTSIASMLNSTTLTLTITGTPNGKLILFNASDIIGEYDYDPNSLNNSIGFDTYFGYYKYLDALEYSSATITAGQDANSYVLNATITCEDGNIYKVVDAPFTYAPPTPWDSEPAKKEEGITLNISDMGKDFASGVLTLYMGVGSYTVALAFPATEDKLAAGTYVINDTEAEGTIIASPGMDGNYPIASYVEKDYYYDYFLRSGSLVVGFSADNKKMTITGDAYTFRETKVTFNVEVDNPYYKGEETLNVTSITPEFDLYNEGQITFQIAASGTGLLSGAVLTVNATELAGEFASADLDMGLSWVGQGEETSTYLDATKANSVKVTQNGFEYTLDATVFGANGSTYKMTGSFVLAELDEEEDNYALLATVMGHTVDLDIKRTFASGMWQTICLPFDIADIDASPLAGAIVKSVTSCNLEGETLMVEAVDVTSMTAGMPYLIKWEGSAPLDESPTFSGVTIAAAEGITSGNFVANMSAKHYDDVTGKYMVVADNGLAPMGTEGSVKGFRAYFQINAPAGVALRKFAFAKSEATGLLRHDAQAIKATKTIKNGRLLIMKGDRVFNAQAQEMK